MMHWGNQMAFGGWGMLFSAVLWIGLIVLGVWALSRLFPAGGRSQPGSHVQNFDQATPSRPPSENALEILQRRYARGEITKEEYETIRSDLAA